MNNESNFADYEFSDEDMENLPIFRLILVAIVLWSGAWWLGHTNDETQSQGETFTTQEVSQ